MRDLQLESVFKLRQSAGAPANPYGSRRGALDAVQWGDTCVLCARARVAIKSHAATSASAAVGGKTVVRLMEAEVGGS